MGGDEEEVEEEEGEEGEGEDKGGVGVSSVPVVNFIATSLLGLITLDTAPADGGVSGCRSSGWFWG